VPAEIDNINQSLLCLPCQPRPADIPFLKNGERPEIIKKLVPDPEWSRIADIHRRTIILEVKIDNEGNVRRCPFVISGSSLLKEYALRAVIQWIFEPYLIKGKPSSAQFVVVIYF